ncbi:MAG: hypothetical protein ACOC4C_02330 [Fibrobacterota bacterium]
MRAEEDKKTTGHWPGTKQAEETVRQDEKEMQIGERLNHLSRLAHDCNNMLGAISGYAELIDLSNKNRGYTRDPKLEQRISAILQASIRAANNIDKIRENLTVVSAQLIK